MSLIKHLGIRIEPSLLQQLKKIAKKQDRKVSNLLRIIIKEYIKNYND